MEKLVNAILEGYDKINPVSIEDYVEIGGFQGLKNALKMSPQEVCNEIKASNLKGRGGAAYPTGVKWEQAYQVENNPKYILCNGDEGEPGTFKDKVIFERIPLKLIEGMTIAAKVLDANVGYIYIRGEYAYLQQIVKEAIENAKAKGYLGENILGTDLSFDIKVLTGAGGYVVGENSALVESSEGKAGRPRMKPPYIKISGLFKMPTLVNNVETFAAVSYIMKNGGETFKSLGNKESGGTKIICLSGNVQNRGVYEVPFGITLGEIIYDIGQGMENGRKLKAVQIGGSSGSIIPASMIDTPLCYEAFKKAGVTLGSGSILVLDDSVSMIEFLKYVYGFFLHESCGKCTPCREGNKQLNNIINRLYDGEAINDDITKMNRILSVMRNASFCGLGKSAPTALECCFKYFKDEILMGVRGEN